MYEKLLCLDLDETLVHSSRRDLRANPDYRIQDIVGVHRPHLQEFMAYTKASFRHVGIWTASDAGYAHAVVESFMDPDDLDFFWCYDRCTLKLSGWEVNKDIRKLRKLGYTNEAIIAVDDRTMPWERSRGNHVQIPEFRGDPADDWLPKLIQYLDMIGDAPDIRAQDLTEWWYWLEGLEEEPAP